MAREPYRFRQCPKCKEVFPAGQLKILNYYGHHWHGRGGSKRKCPHCRHVDFTQGFRTVSNV